MADYVSKYTGAQIDDAVGKALAGTTGGTASVTKESIENALGYTPADKTVTDTLTNKVATLEREVANGITDEDKNAIALMVRDMIEDDTVQIVVDENKNITLTCEEDGVYTIKYYNKDGSTTTISTLTVSGGTGSGSGGNGDSGGGDSGDDDTGGDAVPDTALTWSVGTKLDSSTGAESTSTSYAASNYVEIIDGWTYSLVKTSESAVGAKVCYYDVSKTFLSTSGDVLVTGTATETVAVPIISGAKYFRIRLYVGEGVEDKHINAVTMTATK